MSLDHAVIPFENQSGLYGSLILTELVHKRTEFGKTAMKSGMHPPLQVLAMARADHLCKLLEQAMGSVDRGMDLTHLPERPLLLFSEILVAVQHQPNRSAWSHCCGGGCFGNFTALLLHSTKP